VWERSVRARAAHVPAPPARVRRPSEVSRSPSCSKAAVLGLLEMMCWSADVGKNAALGLPVQRAAFRPASSRRSVEVPVERQQEVAPLERHQ
jgi:hypothetical protein